MAFHGKNFIGAELSAQGTKKIYGFDPKRGEQLQDAFTEATPEEADAAMRLAGEAFTVTREKPAEATAQFLEAIAAEIEALGDALLEQASKESGLAKDRLTGERARTTNQLRMFAGLVREGTYLEARIDTALPDRKPLPRPDLRRIMIPLGPVVVFGASNFPLAFSVAGGDTAAAFAAKNPVVVKAHPAHPGTCEMVATAVLRAVEKTGMPNGTFSMIHAADPEISQLLVKHQDAAAVAFTGSERVGRAIFNVATQRPVPIPAYVEMGSSNPVFLLRGALEQSAENIAQGLFGSITLGVGQFCTSPGIALGCKSTHLDAFRNKLAELFSTAAPGTMLHPSILKGYAQGLEHRAKIEGVKATRSSVSANEKQTEASPVLFETEASVWDLNHTLADEIFGPTAVIVRCSSKDDILRAARNCNGTLTASIFGTPEDLAANRELIAILEQKAGRIIFNGFPTGVEVGNAMHHGGPYPATADPKFTSVGTASIVRFLRPVCFQNFPQQALPPELQNENPRQLWRLVNGTLTKDPV